MTNKVIIVSDTACDLSPELIKQYNVEIIPLHVNFENEEYIDARNIDLQTIFEKVKEKGVLPKTSAVSPAEFITFFGKLLKNNPNTDIVYIGISSTLSSTYQSSLIAVEALETNRIYCVDSKNLSTGYGLLVLKACKYRDQGMNGSQIADRINHILPRVKTQFVIETLEYLKKGGRCKGITLVIANVLKIHPMIVVREGKLVVARKVIGNMKKACLDMMKVFNRDIGKIDPEFVFVTHCRANDYIDYVRDEVIKANFVKNILVTEAGCTIGTHCGPGTIGILYLMKNEDVTLEYEEDV